MNAVKETGFGVIGRPDPVVWQAMQDVMMIKARHTNVSRSLSQARENGQVATSLALCRDQMRIETECSQALIVCERLGGKETAVRALSAFDVDLTV